jgi:hypothetical protein
MEEPSTLAINQFIIDCSELARKLDSVGSRDGKDTVNLTLGECRIEYVELQKRRDEMFMAACDLPIIQIMLDGLLARLSFLERNESRQHKKARLSE